MKKLLYQFSILLIVSCSTVDKPKKPDNLLSKDKMVDIIIEMSMLNSAKGVNKKLLEQKGIDLQKYIYNKHQIDSVQFAKSNEYYAFNMDDYQDIYAKVKDSLEVLKEKFIAIQGEEVRKRANEDSLNRIKVRTQENTIQLIKRPLKAQKDLDAEPGYMKVSRKTD
ncbi:uncharacterized protein DUF4296 [Oceanihabitans sediminis]|uniref:DUF4296 domain-containing protein n=1 Tax=Oceanihabitans sediminis TaxID=1812012 RepID=A0A368P9J3_9FLAO|nr:DUF4296 domain-containing protein [Oceanihabitans sediminis]RBP34958.1 uncharacterized protein DUF4296 [Oceanihabitans sediminis]RCU58595.1 DUF4296 domain-containing protein [Oceanihabitans sediminis]